MTQENTDNPSFDARLEVDGKPVFAQVRFANDADIQKLATWQNHTEEVLPRTKENVDILEYAALSSKFWNLYTKSKNLVKTLGQLEQIVKKESVEVRNDLFFILLLEKDGIDYGFAAIRRSWKNTLKIEYLFINPLAMKGKEIRGVGSSLLANAVLLANLIEAPMLWGESADSAVKFYEKKGFSFFEEIFYLQKMKYQQAL
jgi:N-acetylglutamate synthase-like GNAT family acetyltransferase